VPRAAGSGEARDAGGACLLLGAIPRARRRGRCASGTRESGGSAGDGGGGVRGTRQGRVVERRARRKARGKTAGKSQARIAPPGPLRGRGFAANRSPRARGAREDAREREPALARVGARASKLVVSAPSAQSRSEKARVRAWRPTLGNDQVQCGAYLSG
jgi:hypothetical protein